MVNDSDLMEDHREVDSKLDKLTKIISNGEIDPELFMQISNSLKRHIYIEEETIFPSVSEGDKDLRQRIVGLEMEHASIWMLLDRVEKEISARDIEKAPKYIEEINSILKAHNEQEEEKVYPLMRENEQYPNARIHDYNIPEGWICHRLRRKNR